MKDAIYDRISVRTYEKKALTKKEKDIIDDLIKKASLIKGPFGHQVNFFTDHQESNLDNEAKRIGTYGFIKNAPSFIGGSVTNEITGIIDFGYIFEYLFLGLTKEGFGTCWLGGTFDRGAFSKYVSSNEVIPAITPVGYQEDKMSFRERITRIAVKANRRKPFEEMFYLDDIFHPLQENMNHQLKSALELVKLAPSASNKQPWRIIINDQNVHFYLERTPNYGTKLPFSIQFLDMGIALLHFEIGLKELGMSYEMKKLETQTPNNFEYILSFTLKA